jgi:WD40 repeat protein
MDEGIKKTLIDAIKPYEQRIERLEELNREKEREIVTLKHAIFNLHRIIETLQSGLAKTPPSEKKLRLEERKIETLRLSEKKRSFSPKPSSAKKINSFEEGGFETQFGRKSLTLFPPSQPTPENIAPLPYELSISRIQGYNGRTGRSNLHFIDDSIIVYPAGRLAVIFNMDMYSQTVYSAHSSEITALSAHKQRRICVSSNSEGNMSSIHIWEVDTRLTLKTLTTQIKGIQAVGICPKSELVIVLGMDIARTVMVFRWETDPQPVIVSNSDKALIFGLHVDPFTYLRFVTYGEKYVKCWKISGNSAESKKVVMTTTDTPKAFLSACYLRNGNCLLGTDNGLVYVISDNVVKQRIKAHDQSIGALTYFLDENNDQYILTAGNEGKIGLWNDDMQLVTMLNYLSAELLSSPTASLGYKPKSMDVQNTGVIILGTSSNFILRTTLNAETLVLITGHVQEVNCIAIHPSMSHIVTGGSDKTLRIWDGALLRVIKIELLNNRIKSLAFNAEGKNLAVGLAEGNVIIYSWPDLSILQDLKTLATPINTLKYSREHEYLGAGNKDKIFIWKADDSYKLVSIIPGLGNIRSFNFSKSYTYILAETSELELLLFELTGKRLNRLSLVRDEEWEDWSLAIGWQVKNIWTKNTSSFTTLSTNWNSNYLASGESNGTVISTQLKVFTFPCVDSSQFISYKAHAGAVMEVRWVGNGNLVSCGGDGIVIVWSCIF